MQTNMPRRHVCVLFEKRITATLYGCHLQAGDMLLTAEVCCAVVSLQEAVPVDVACAIDDRVCMLQRRTLRITHTKGSSACFRRAAAAPVVLDPPLSGVWHDRNKLCNSQSLCRLCKPARAERMPG